MKKGANQWLSLINDANLRDADKIPAGFFSAAQIANETGKCRSTVESGLDRQVKAGKVEMKMFRGTKGRGAFKHYRIL